MNTIVPSISVITPLYNKGKWVARCVSSVLEQSCVNFEFIIVDDGSTDTGAAVVRSFDDKRIRLVSQENSGASSARNAAIRLARGEYAAFLDADDEWQPGHLSVLLEAASACPDVAAVCDDYYGPAHRYVDAMDGPPDAVVSAAGEEVRCYRFDFLEKLAAGHFVTSCSSTMVRTRLLHENNLFFSEKMVRGEDTNFWINLSRCGSFLYCNHDGVCYHRDDPESEMNRRRSSARAMPDFFLEIPSSDFTAQQATHIRQFLANEYLKAAYMNRGLAFDSDEMACRTLQKRNLLLDLLYLGIRFCPNALVRIGKSLRNKFGTRRS